MRALPLSDDTAGGRRARRMSQRFPASNCAAFRVNTMSSRHWLAIIALLLPCAAHAAALSQRGAAMLSPVPSACISSPFGPRVLPNRPLAGQYHYGIDMPAPAGEAVRATAPGKVMRIQRKGPGGLEVLVQHDGFVGIYSHLGMVTPSLAEGKTHAGGGRETRRRRP